MTEEKKEFVVKDRRIFAGDSKEKEQQKTEKTPEEGKTKEKPSPKAPDQDRTGEQAAQKLQTDKIAGAAASDKTSEAETC